MPAIDNRAHSGRRRHGAILTLLFVVLALAGGQAWALAEPEKQEPTVEKQEPTVEKEEPTVEKEEPPLPLSPVEPVFDLGTLVKGDVTTHTFVLRNTGQEPLTIERVEPDCGCTVAKFDEVIRPGGEGTVAVDVDTRTLNGVGSTSLKVFARGRTAPAALLELKFNVVSKLLARPGYARWIYVQREPEGTLGQTVYAGDGADFAIVSVESPMPAIAVTYREAKPEERIAGFEGRQWRIEPTLDAEAPVGAIAGFIKVHTTHPRQKLLEIPVSGFVRPILFVDPQPRDLGTLHLSAPRRAVYQVRNFATEPIALTGVETDVPGVSARLEPIEKGRRYKLIVEFDPSAMKEGPFAGKVRVKTDSEKVPMLTVDLTGTLVRQAAEKSG